MCVCVHVWDRDREKGRIVAALEWWTHHVQWIYFLIRRTWTSTAAVTLDTGHFPSYSFDLHYMLQSLSLKTILDNVSFLVCAKDSFHKFTTSLNYQKLVTQLLQVWTVHYEILKLVKSSNGIRKHNSRPRLNDWHWISNIMSLFNLHCFSWKAKEIIILFFRRH